MASATAIAEEIRARIFAETGLTASAGISYNKFLAKMASDERKPNGQFVITPKKGPSYVEGLPVGKFHGIGPATQAKMEGLGIRDGADLKGQTLEFLREHFGKVGPYYYALARGIDERPVCADRVRKSVGAETTFGADLFTAEEARAALEPLITKVWSYCEGSTIRGRTATLKAKYADFQQITRSRSLEVPIDSRDVLEELVGQLLKPLFPVSKGIRLLGVTLSSLEAEGELRVGQQMLLPI
jgi:DNA polymerase IV